jgi:two-component system OmpR family sensor kinase
LQPPGFHVTEWNQQMWRTYTVVRSSRTAQVAVALQDRDSSFYAFIPWVLVPIGVLVLLLGLLIHEAVKRALRPLDALSKQIGSRKLSELHALEASRLPTEVAPLAQALNKLLAQLDQLLGSQRQFLADAAHELNTPLAAIKLQAQLTRKAQDSERDAALNELDTGIERAIHLASQLLQLARLEPDARAPERSEVRMSELVRQAVITLSPLAEARGTDLGLLRCETVTLMGDPHALRVLLDNLIDNALRYSPADARVDVDLTVQDGQAQLRVSDNGPGIAKEQHARALERFVRLQSGETTGSGLGLAIVHHIVQAHGGTLAFDATPGGGLTVLVTLPLSAAH